MHFLEETNFIWNDDISSSPSYFHWAPGEPNLNPEYSTNYVQIMSWSNNAGKVVGKWLIPDDQTIANYICQAPKVIQHTTPQEDTTTPWDETTTPSEEYECMDLRYTS